jgi:choline-sulfatase
MPARASFISGLYPHNHGMWGNSGRLPEGEESLFRRLQQAGYCTAHIGKSHYYAHGPGHLKEHEPYLHARGFEDVHETTGPWATTSADSYMTDRWAELGLLDAFREDYAKRYQHGPTAVWPSPLPAEEFPDSYVGRTATEYLEQYSDERPFCLFVGFGGPHEPFDAPGTYAEMYAPSQMPPAIPAAEPGEWVPEHVRQQAAEGHGASGYFSTAQPQATSDQIAALRANYCGKISLIDHWFGRMLSVVKERGWAEQTLVVFWSDHGEMAGDHRRLHKNVFYESALRIPLILRWPERTIPNTVSDALACTVDIFPTVLEAAGAEVGERSQGTSLWPVLERPDAELRNTVFSEVLGPCGEIMARTKECKYVMDRSGRGWALYDLRNDPDEQVNLLGREDHLSLEQEMREKILVFLASTQPIRSA